MAGSELSFALSCGRRRDGDAEVLLAGVDNESLGAQNQQGSGRAREPIVPQGSTAPKLRQAAERPLRGPSVQLRILATQVGCHGDQTMPPHGALQFADDDLCRAAFVAGHKAFLDRNSLLCRVG
jgi:hypothetical protein